MFLLPKPEVEWKSPWRIDFERYLAERPAKRIVSAPQIRARRERSSPRCRNQRVTPTKFCGGCGKGLKSNTASGFCQPCMRARARCACGRTIFKNNSLTQCKQCHVRDSRKKCPLCPNVLNASNTYGLCKPHYAKYRRFIFQEQLSICADCPRLINRDNRFGRCVKHSKNFYLRDQRAKAKLLKAAA